MHWFSSEHRSERGLSLLSTGVGDRSVVLNPLFVQRDHKKDLEAANLIEEVKKWEYFSHTWCKKVVVLLSEVKKKKKKKKKKEEKKKKKNNQDK